MIDKSEYVKFVRYVNAVADAMQAIEEEIALGLDLKDDTVLKLNELEIAAQELADIFETVGTLN